MQEAKYVLYIPILNNKDKIQMGAHFLLFLALSSFGFRPSSLDQQLSASAIYGAKFLSVMLRTVF